MNKPAEQNLKNHARFDPAFHAVLFGVLAVNLIVAIVHVVLRVDHFGAWWALVLSLAVFILFIKVRTYPMKVQDRVIRLEERLRLQALAPEAWKGEVLKLSEDQLIGLRFASDDEVVELAQQALAEGLNRKQIKERVKVWRADHWRV
jgi:hypothetical protein